MKKSTNHINKPTTRSALPLSRIGCKAATATAEKKKKYVSKAGAEETAKENGEG